MADRASVDVLLPAEPANPCAAFSDSRAAPRETSFHSARPRAHAMDTVTRTGRTPSSVIVRSRKGQATLYSSPITPEWRESAGEVVIARASIKRTTGPASLR